MSCLNYNLRYYKFSFCNAFNLKLFKCIFLNYFLAFLVHCWPKKMSFIPQKLAALCVPVFAWRNSARKYAIYLCTCHFLCRFAQLVLIFDLGAATAVVAVVVVTLAYLAGFSLSLSLSCFGQVCSKLGWKGKGSEWDILPLVVSANGHDPDYFDYPPELILEVPLSHPK